MISNFEEATKYLNALSSCTTKCECGHSVFMSELTPKSVCNWCYRTVYNKNQLGQRQKFKDQLMKNKKRKEISGSNGSKNKQN